MAFGSGRQSISIEDILCKTTEANILAYYLGISKIPCLIKSPLREDNSPSFGLYSRDGKKVKFYDFSTRESGGTFDLLCRLWNKDLQDVLDRIDSDFKKIPINTKITKDITNICRKPTYNGNIDLQCKTREWRPYDIQYWESFGIPLKWLKYAEVYPISHSIITKEDKKYTFTADKYAYAYVERKEGKVSLKLYQPFNTKGHKWTNKNDGSVIGLWTKVPSIGSRICICSSLKDALCLWANYGVPSIYLQGEGYSMSKTAIDSLKTRFGSIYILLDNDEPGIKNAEKLSEDTGFINIVLPTFAEGKDIADYYKAKGKAVFLDTMSQLFNDKTYKEDELPF